MDPESPDQSPPSRLPLIAIGALVVLAVAVGIGFGLRGVKDFADGTPEAALQDYLDAALDGDREAVLASLGRDQQAACDKELRDRLWTPSGVGFALDEIEIDGDVATATVTQRYSDNDPFGSTSRRGTEDFELHKEADGEWRITKASWPYTVRNCLEGDS